MDRIIFLAFGLSFAAIMIAALSRTALLVLKFYIKGAHPYARLRLWLNFIGGASGFDWCDNCQSFHPKPGTIEELKKLPWREAPHVGPHLDPENDVRRVGPHRPTDPESEIIAANLTGFMATVEPQQLAAIVATLRPDQALALIDLVKRVGERGGRWHVVE